MRTPLVLGCTVGVLLWGVAGSSLAQQVVVPSERVTTGLRVRSAPSTETSDNIVGHLRPGDQAPLIDSDTPQWHRIRFQGQPRFVSKAWCDVIDAEDAPGSQPAGGPPLRVHFLNSGSGACQVVECPGAAPIIFDCGNTGRSDPDLDLNAVVAYIQQILDASPGAPRVVLSHGDTDHYSYIPNVMGTRTPASVWLGGARADYTGPIAAWLATHQAVIHDGFLAGHSNGGQPIAELDCGPAETKILTVNVGTTTNSQSLVASVQHGSFVVVFAGDAVGATETSARTNYPNLRATVLTGSHHGANTEGSNGQAWADALLPEVTVFTTGTRHGHPRCAAMTPYGPAANAQSRLRAAGGHSMVCGTGGNAYGALTTTTRAEYSTRVNGRIVIESDGADYGVTCSLSPGCGPTDQP